MEEAEPLRRTALDYARRGIGEPMGMGQRPLLVVIDMCNAFLDDSYGLGKSMPGVLCAVRDCVEAFRNAQRPVVFIKTEYVASMIDAGVWVRKIPALCELMADTPAVDIHADLDLKSGDRLITKKASSAFFGTELVQFCISEEIDTIIAVGVSTSACVRATVVDSCSYGFRTGVVIEAVGDRSMSQHASSLFDMQAKYADLLTLDDLQGYLIGVRQ